LAFLLDTNIVSELTRPRPDAGVVAFLEQNSDLYLSVVVLHELEYGVHCAADLEKRAKLQNFSVALRIRFFHQILHIDMQIAQTAGRMRAEEKSRGRILAELDAFIAATAAVKSATLVTRNIKDFERLDVRLYNPFRS
jgi:predicted nucleic acid-binding protein